MCLEYPQPCDLEEVVAYKVMRYDKKNNTVTSMLSKDTYTLGETYEAQVLPEDEQDVCRSEVYTKGFHAYVKEDDAFMSCIHFYHFPSPIVIVKVLLKDITFEQKGYDARTQHIYVANKCTFLKVVKEGV